MSHHEFVIDAALQNALDALEHARAAYWDEMGRTWTVQPTTNEILIGAWSRVHSLIPSEVAIPRQEVPACDAGAPMPMVVSDGSTVWLTYYVDDDSGERAIVSFNMVDSVLFGGPNDEALSGHRLATRGLAPYTFHEVLRSDWIATRESENSVHEWHQPGWHARMRHFVFTFHDETFECLAREFTVGDEASAHPAAAISLQSGESPAEPVGFCCIPMRNQVQHICDEHPDPADCPDALIAQRTGNWHGLRVHDGGSSAVHIHFCPWCGSRL